ncbi:MAG TPA: cyclic dehypoxanthinyl futalosine synthase [Polyangiaceae bacterium]|nr:cyclic dehypoxanthinyl futalosine synthase [Polyangiaceae bacterium]
MTRPVPHSGAARSQALRVAAVGYLNARPLYEGLRARASEGALRLDCAVPSEVARQVAEDEADIALMPVAAAATIGDLRMVRGMAIGARGPVRSVVIAAEQPIETLEELAVDLSSRTSVVLTRLVLRHRFGREPRLVGQGPREAIAGVAGKRGAMVIGDSALEIEGRFPHVVDLGLAWREWTDLPFVFAAWCGRKGALSAEDERLLEEAKAEGLARRGAIADEHAGRTGLSPASLRRYLEDAVRYDFGDEERRGLERFYDEAARAGLLPKASVQFFDEDRKSSFSLPSLDGVLARAADGERLSAAEGERLLAEASLFDLGLAADTVRRRKHPHDVVTYIVDRNVNYTNVCTTSCRFCAFYRPPGHPEGWVLSRETLAKKLQEVVDAGGVQILLQGGLHPDLAIGWYEDLFRWIKTEFRLGLHALSPEEILHIARLEGLSVRGVLERLRAAGLDSVPGGGAEILVDRVRRTIAKAKCTSEEWLGVMRVAHAMGLRSSATMMYGTVDTARDRIAHLVKVRDLQDETGGFTAFFCWDFQHERGTHIEPGENGTVLYLRQQAMARILLDNVDHVGASWVTQGPEVGQVALRFGADDFGSVMFEENVVSSAGTTFCMNADAMERRIRAAGFKAARRNVRYDWLTAPV